MVVDELLSHVFGDTAPALAAQCEEWIISSRRFKAFVEMYRDKIRKKLRNVRDEEGYRDLQAELATAHLLLQERRLAVDYEPLGIGKQRGPDFAVIFKSHLRFNVEVTRIRWSDREQPAHETNRSTKVITIVCDKLGQMPPNEINILLLVADGSAYTASDVANAMKLLKARAERKEEPFFTQRGFDSARDYLACSRRLSGVVVRTTGDHGSNGRAELWANPEAKHPLPTAVRTILLR